jgi:hypothetical protein
MKYKETRSLFLGKYQYKIALVCSSATLFRGGDIDNAVMELAKIDIRAPEHFSYWSSRIKSSEDLEYVRSLCSDFKKITDYDLRVEQPIINIYTNDIKSVKLFEKKYSDTIKFISKPSSDGVLTSDTIIMNKMNFDYRITMGATKQEYSTFVEWAENHPKIKLTKSCIRDLHRNRSWGGTHFYVTGDNNLLMTKMHLGGTISKVQRIIHQAEV